MNIFYTIVFIILSCRAFFGNGSPPQDPDINRQTAAVLRQLYDVHQGAKRGEHGRKDSRDILVARSYHRILTLLDSSPARTIPLGLANTNAERLGKW